MTQGRLCYTMSGTVCTIHPIYSYMYNTSHILQVKKKHFVNLSSSAEGTWGIEYLHDTVRISTRTMNMHHCSQHRKQLQKGIVMDATFQLNT